MDVGFFNIFFDMRFDATLLSAVFAFATVVTLGLPLLERNALGNRMKAVAERREELRRKHHAALKQRGGLRTEPLVFVKQTVERLNLSRIVEAEGTRERLARAGYRGQGALVTFVFFRFVMPFIVFVAALIFLFLVSHLHWSSFMKLNAAVGTGLAGFYLPDLFLSSRTAEAAGLDHAGLSRRARSDADLRRIGHVRRSRLHPCVGRGRRAIARTRGGAGADHGRAFLSARAANGLRQSRQTLRPFGREGRRGCRQPGGEIRHAGGPGLRVTAQENREQRMMAAEKKAAALSPKLTVPMLIFFLPCLFVVIMGPAVMNIMHTLH